SYATLPTTPRGRLIHRWVEAARRQIQQPRSWTFNARSWTRVLEDGDFQVPGPSLVKTWGLFRVTTNPPTDDAGHMTTIPDLMMIPFSDPDRARSTRIVTSASLTGHSPPILFVTILRDFDILVNSDQLMPGYPLVVNYGKGVFCFFPAVSGPAIGKLFW